MNFRSSNWGPNNIPIPVSSIKTPGESAESSSLHCTYTLGSGYAKS